MAQIFQGIKERDFFPLLKPGDENNCQVIEQACFKVRQFSAALYIAGFFCPIKQQWLSIFWQIFFLLQGAAAFSLSLSV